MLCQEFVMPSSRKPKPAQHDPRLVGGGTKQSVLPQPADEQRRALQMSMDTRQ
jgi:hypothetical protein